MTPIDRCGSGPVACHGHGRLSDAVSDRRRWSWRRPFWLCGSRPPLSRGGSADRCSPRSRSDGRPDYLSSEACPQDLGILRAPSSARTIIGCRPITIRSIRWRGSRIARRRPIWDWRCSRILSAYDFGYLSAGQLIERTTKRSHAWRRWNGTEATSTTGTTRNRLKPLLPTYVSTVDSGNLAGHLLTLRPDCSHFRIRRFWVAILRRAQRHIGYSERYVEKRAAGPRRYAFRSIWQLRTSRIAADDAHGSAARCLDRLATTRRGSRCDASKAAPETAGAAMGARTRSAMPRRAR